MTEQTSEKPEDAWIRITAALSTRSDEELWRDLDDMASYRGGNPEQNLTLAALVHTLAERDEEAQAAFESWKQGPEGGGDSGHIVAWMQTATRRVNTHLDQDGR